MLSALLRKLGYTDDSPQYYHSLTLKFSDIATRDAFLGQISFQTRYKEDRWIRQLPQLSKDKPEVTLQDVTLESPRIETPPYHLGMFADGWIQGRRSMRALIIPAALLNVNESLNLFPWEFGKISSQKTKPIFLNEARFFNQGIIG
jgi:hypothetical protein